MKAVVITVSDRVSRGEAEDLSGPAACAALEALGFVPEQVVVADGIEAVTGSIRSAIAAGSSLVVTTGGTGLGPRDHTPEATAALIERPAPGISEAMRAATFGTNAHGMLSRGVSGVVGSTLVVNLPGSVAGVTEGLAVIGPALPHAVRLLLGEHGGH